MIDDLTKIRILGQLGQIRHYVLDASHATTKGDVQELRTAQVDLETHLNNLNVITAHLNPEGQAQ